MASLPLSFFAEDGDLTPAAYRQFEGMRFLEPAQSRLPVLSPLNAIDPGYSETEPVEPTVSFPYRYLDDSCCCVACERRDMEDDDYLDDYYDPILDYGLDFDPVAEMEEQIEDYYRSRLPWDPDYLDYETEECYSQQFYGWEDEYFYLDEIEDIDSSLADWEAEFLAEASAAVNPLYESPRLSPERAKRTRRQTRDRKVRANGTVARRQDHGTSYTEKGNACKGRRTAQRTDRDVTYVEVYSGQSLGRYSQRNIQPSRRERHAAKAEINAQLAESYDLADLDEEIAWDDFIREVEDCRFLEFALQDDRDAAVEAADDPRSAYFTALHSHVTDPNGDDDWSEDSVADDPRETPTVTEEVCRDANVLDFRHQVWTAEDLDSDMYTDSVPEGELERLLA